MKPINYLLILCLLFVLGCSAKIERKDILVFFNYHCQLIDDFDPAILNHYKDTAKIHSLKNISKTKVEMSGADVKKSGIELIEHAKEIGDTFTYSNIEVSYSGTLIKIEANRFSRLQNYTDTAYYMVVEKNSKGQYQIVEEYLETND